VCLFHPLLHFFAFWCQIVSRETFWQAFFLQVNCFTWNNSYCVIFENLRYIIRKMQSF
jgi:hypothetical protein